MAKKTVEEIDRTLDINFLVANATNAVKAAQKQMPIVYQVVKNSEGKWVEDKEHKSPVIAVRFSKAKTFRREVVYPIAIQLISAGLLTGGDKYTEYLYTITPKKGYTVTQIYDLFLKSCEKLYDQWYKKCEEWRNSQH